MDEPAQEEDQSSAELADGEKSDSDDSDIQPDGGDVPAEDQSAEEEGQADDVSAEDELDEKPKVVPVERLRQVIEERNDAREQNKIFKALIAKQSLEKEGGTKEEERQVKADLSKYTPKQVAEAKALLSGVLGQEMGQLSELAKEVKKLREENEANRQTQFAQQDNVKLVSTLKEFKGEFKRSEVEAQIQAWHSSGNQELMSLAKAPYRTILREMQAMRSAKAGKKPKPAPRVPSDGGSEESGKPLKPSSKGRPRPNPSDTTGWEDNLARKAHQMMTTEEE